MSMMQFVFEMYSLCREPRLEVMLISILICLSCKVRPFDGGPIGRPDNLRRDTTQLIFLILE